MMQWRPGLYLCCVLVSAAIAPAWLAIPRAKAAETQGYTAAGALEYMIYEKGLSPTGARKPVIKVRTSHVELSEGGKVVFRDASAVLLDKDGAETRFTAGAGSLDEAAGTAQLTDGVRLEYGAMVAELEDVTVDAGRVAWSDKPVRIQNADSRLSAASFRFHAEGEGEALVRVLDLTGVEGVLSLKMAQDAASAPKTGGSPMALKYERMVIRKAPDVRMALTDGAPRFESLRGGVDIALEAEDSKEASAGLVADEAAFSYAKPGDAMPSEIKLKGSVKMDGPMGTIRARSVSMDLRARRFEFDGEVRGETSTGEKIHAEGLTYGPDGIRLRDGVRIDSKEGVVVADSARRDERTGALLLQGNVSIDAGDSSIRAGRVEKDENTGRIQASGGVEAQTAEGVMRAGSAQVDEQGGVRIFEGGVTGSFGEIKDFTASRIVQQAKTGEVEIIDLVVPRMDLSGGTAEQDQGAQSSPFSFSSIAVDKAPKVRLLMNKVRSIDGGVNLRLLSGSGPDASTRVQADNAVFAYAEGTEGSLPEKVTLDGGVQIDGTLGNIKADSAMMFPGDKRLVLSGHVDGSTPEVERFQAEQLVYAPDGILLEGTVAVKHPQGNVHADMARIEEGVKGEGAEAGNGRRMVFTGNVYGDTPQLQGLVADEVVYDFVTGSTTMKRARIKEFVSRESDKPDLDVSDVLDWQGFLMAIKRQAASTEPTPGKWMVNRMPEPIQRALLGITTQRPPNAGAQKAITHEINKLLESPDFYHEESWKGIALDETTHELVSRDTASMSTEDILKRNRGLLEAAFSGYIAKYGG